MTEPFAGAARGRGTERPRSIAELKAVAQPPEVRGRRNAEHWTASLYLRSISPYLTWLLLRTRISANQVTGLMILVGWCTAFSLLIPGIPGALLALVLGQLQMLVDCCDGEVARWRGTSSPAGVFLDKVGHYSTEALIPIVFGIRAAAYPFEAPADFLWTTLAALFALFVVLNKALNDMVHVARANAGLPKLADTHGESAPRRPATRGALRSVPPSVPLRGTDDHHLRRCARGCLPRGGGRQPRRAGCTHRSRAAGIARPFRHDHGIEACPFLSERMPPRTTTMSLPSASWF
jgi:hypothetical protein